VRVLITGASGLAGGHLVRACAQAGDDVIGVSRSGTISDPSTEPDPATEAANGEAARIEPRSVDLRDPAAVTELLIDTQPDVIYHLAALSSVGRSWEDPAATVQANVSSAVNLLEGLRHHAPDARTVWVSTCEVYGAADELPIPETAPLKPANPYAVSKVTGDLLAGVYADAHGLQIVRARPFNHAGPGQRPIFILSSLAQQGARARIEGAERIEIVTGNPDTRRDFTDVRDVVRAYRLLAELDEPGIYNVCSGVSVSAAVQVALLAELIAPIEVTHVVDPARVRAHEVMDLRGSSARIHATLGWQPQLSLRDTMRDTLQWWERQLTASPSSGPP
jgi:GDP-4-dehydro-6-deoxy-D-mannose reductase